MVKIDASNTTCHWCGSIESFRCTCGFRTCADCLKFPSETGCVHKKYEKVESDGWRLDESTDP